MKPTRGALIWHLVIKTVKLQQVKNVNDIIEKVFTMLFIYKKRENMILPLC